MHDRPNCGALSKPRSSSLVFGFKHNHNFSKTKIRNKNSIFWLMEKHLSYNFRIWKNAYHRVFIQFSVRMELYDKKFIIYGNCMIRSFGKPGLFNEFFSTELRKQLALTSALSSAQLYHWLI